MAEFSQDDINLIKRTWEVVMADPEESGGAIFVEYFTNHPSNQEKFPKFKGKPANELITVPHFRKHGAMIMHVLDDTIKTLDTTNPEEGIEKIWREIADTHFWIYHVTRTSYSQLKNSVVDLMARVCNLNKDEAAVWTKLLDHVFSILFRIYEEYETQAKET